MIVHKKESLLEAVGGVVSLLSLMAEHDLHFDQVLEFVERGVVDVFLELGPYLSVYCVDAATTTLEFPTFFLAYSDFVSVDPRPNISVPHKLPVNIRFLRVSVFCVRRILMALRSGNNFSVSQQIFNYGIGVSADGEYSFVRPERNPNYKLAGFDDSVQWCFGVYSQSVPPFLTHLGSYYSSPGYTNIVPDNLWISESGAKKIESSLVSAVVNSLPDTDALTSSLSVAAIKDEVILSVRNSNSSGESDKLLDMNDLIKTLSFSRSKINNLRSPANAGHDPTFPKPVDTGSTAVRWRESDINEWISSRKLKA